MQRGIIKISDIIGKVNFLEYSQKNQINGFLIIPLASNTTNPITVPPPPKIPNNTRASPFIITIYLTNFEPYEA